jgi:hypothetical protein
MLQQKRAGNGKAACSSLLTLLLTLSLTLLLKLSFHKPCGLGGLNMSHAALHPCNSFCHATPDCRPSSFLQRLDDAEGDLQWILCSGHVQRQQESDETAAQEIDMCLSCAALEETDQEDHARSCKAKKACEASWAVLERTDKNGTRKEELPSSDEFPIKAQTSFLQHFLFSFCLNTLPRRFLGALFDRLWVKDTRETNVTLIAVMFLKGQNTRFGIVFFARCVKRGKCKSSARARFAFSKAPEKTLQGLALAAVSGLLPSCSKKTQHNMESLSSHLFGFFGFPNPL